LKSAVLCTHLEQDCLIAGCFDGYTYFVDPRGPGIVSRHRYHHSPVLSIAVDDKNVMSVGEDCLLVVLDRRQDEVSNVPVGLPYLVK